MSPNDKSLEKAILDYIENNPGCTASDIDKGLSEYRKYSKPSSNVQRIILRLKSLQSRNIIAGLSLNPKKYFMKDQTYEVHRTISGDLYIFIEPAIDGLHLVPCATCSHIPILHADKKCLICYCGTFDDGQFYVEQIMNWNRKQKSKEDVEK